MDYHIYRLIYINSMRDAVRQRAYSGDGIEPKKRLEDEKLMRILMPYITPLINGALHNTFESLEAYDAAFLETTINVCQTINENPENHFNFGNAQKLINMILKYFYITTYQHEESRIGFIYCHCPMDQQLLEKVWNNRSDLNSTPSLGTRADFLRSWGYETFQEDNGILSLPDRYTLFQTAVKELANKEITNGRPATALEYDFINWGS